MRRALVAVALAVALLAPSLASSQVNCQAIMNQLLNSGVGVMGPGGADQLANIYNTYCMGGASQPQYQQAPTIECPAGMAPGSGQRCMQIGSIDCGNGTSCPAGNVCINNGTQCLPRSSGRVCRDGSSYCNEGSICTNEGTCLSVASARVCSEHQYCNDGFKCAGAGRCIPEQNTECGSNSCTPGFYCGSNSVCMRAGSDDCGNGTSCASGTTCSRNHRMCLASGEVDCGSHTCSAGFKCGSNNTCLQEDAIDCGDGTACASNQSCVTRYNSANGNVYHECLTSEELAARREAERQQQLAEAARRKQEEEERQAAIQQRIAQQKEAARQAEETRQQAIAKQKEIATLKVEAVRLHSKEGANDAKALSDKFAAAGVAQHPESGSIPECETAYDMLEDFKNSRSHWATECPGGVRAAPAPASPPASTVQNTETDKQRPVVEAPPHGDQPASAEQTGKPKTATELAAEAEAQISRGQQAASGLESALSGQRQSVTAAGCETAEQLLDDLAHSRPHWGPECPGGVAPKGVPAPPSNTAPVTASDPADEKTPSNAVGSLNPDLRNVVTLSPTEPATAAVNKGTPDHAAITPNAQSTFAPAQSPLVTPLDSSAIKDIAEMLGPGGPTEQLIQQLMDSVLTTTFNTILTNPNAQAAFESALTTNLSNLGVTTKGVSVDVAEGLITNAAVNALNTTMTNAGYSDYLREPAKFTLELTLNDGFAAITPSSEALGGPEGAVTFATIRTTASELISVANAGTGVVAQTLQIRQDFQKLNQSAGQVDTLANSAKSAGNLQESERLVRLEQSTRSTIASLRQQYTVLGVSILDQ